MKPLLFASTLSFMVLFTTSPSAHEWQMWKYVPSVWKIRAEGVGQCSSVLVGKKGIYLTAAHCVTVYEEIEENVWVETGTVRTVDIGDDLGHVGQVLHVSQHDDLAVFQAGVRGVPLPIASKEPLVGQQVAMLGYGMNAFSITAVPSWWMGHPWRDGAAMAGGVIAGMSGGPVVNTNGEVVGLVRSVRLARYLNISFAVELHAIQRAVKQFVR